MKVVQINTFPNKATGSIMMNIHNELNKQGVESYVVWGRGRKSNSAYEISINDSFGVKYHGLYTRISDKTGFCSKRATNKLIMKLDEINPDIIHLHNIHGYYINIEMLFNYIKDKNIKIIWTLHDCWSFTGHCAYFDMISCDKWKLGCYRCKQSNTYPKSIKDNSMWNWKRKKELFTEADITIVTPSKWLSKHVKESFMKEYEINIINNGIDLNIFKPIDSDFRKKYDIENKVIILGVASEWTERKGLKDFIKLNKILDDRFKIVLVGLSKKQINNIEDNIIKFERTNNIKELVEIYSSADIFFNPTYEDNFPTTNLEALACGTPICTYETGGSSECIDGNNGIVIKQGSIEQFADFLKGNVNIKSEYKINSIDKFDKSLMIEKYMDLYTKVMKRGKLNE